MRKTIFTLIAAIALLASCTRIDAGYEGILVNQYGTEKGVSNVQIKTGRVWYNPFTQDVVEFPLFVKTIDYSAFTVNAKDGSVFTIDPTLSYAVVQGKAPFIYVKYRKDLDEITTTTMFNYVKNAFRIQMNKYTTEQLISNRQQFEDSVEANLGKTLESDGFRLESLTSGLQYPKSIVEAVDAKNRAVQESMQAQNQLVRDSINARREVIVAEGERQANLLRQSSLTNLLIQQQFIEKWDGRTPLYGNSPVVFKNVQ
ncbi:Regulator of protease activity HflC, stomatin/prohibitin superfamily [Arachidicoccus rhizosphaerae]|uniref:Regulator of protease activity HflC, stomatin/prohibitin superfamily n=1 Tax=Arachidicoccus rhizosphaerae TaxID=551991 RepID=A0A1H3W480_9BACT|nr:Regulator of protease activity HflC, stomatin/prohibitin superfamily [Arachidicoccus rhizosphaerae]